MTRAGCPRFTADVRQYKVPVKREPQPWFHGALPTLADITEDVILAIRDEEQTSCCPECSGGRGVCLGEKYVELYSIHYVDTVRVFGCPSCFRIWYEHLSRELA